MGGLCRQVVEEEDSKAWTWGRDPAPLARLSHIATLLLQAVGAEPNVNKRISYSCNQQLLFGSGCPGLLSHPSPSESGLPASQALPLAASAFPEAQRLWARSLHS